MQADPHLPVAVALVPEGVLDVRDRAGGGARELVRPHRERDFAVAVDLMVVEDHLAEALLRVDGEPVVLGEAPGDGVVPDEYDIAPVASGRKTCSDALVGLKSTLLWP